MNGGNHHIQLRGVEVHNLQKVDLDLPREKLVVICGVSGSGKTSLALDTLYAEGQRRYIESFSAYSRQFVQRLDKPAAERIEGTPPSIAVTRGGTSQSNRATVGTTTEILDYLRLLFARLGEVVCETCGRPVRRYTPETAAREIESHPAGRRLLLGFEITLGDDPQERLRDLAARGFIRAVRGKALVQLADPSVAESLTAETLLVVVDRLRTGDEAAGRLRDSLETAFGESGAAVALIEADANAMDGPAEQRLVDERTWSVQRFPQERSCCGRSYPDPSPQLLSFNHPLGACPTCEGFGGVLEYDVDLIVPNERQTIRGGAIACWTTPKYKVENQRLIQQHLRLGVSVDQPWRELSAVAREAVLEGRPDLDFPGVLPFLRELERQKHKMPIRVFLSRWKSNRPCPACGGQRLRPAARAVRIDGVHLAELAGMSVVDAQAWLAEREWSPSQRQLARAILEQVASRLGYLAQVGLDYLTLDRVLRTLSAGEAQRVALTGALGSSLVNMLYVLDEPSIGLHPADTERLVTALRRLRDRRNSVVVVEHEEAVIQAADHLIEIGPGAGANGGRVTFEGSVAEALEPDASLTGEYLTGRRGQLSERRRPTRQGAVELRGCRGHNLHDIDVSFPLGVLCLVTGVSGAGKSTLVQDTLFPAVSRALRKEAPKPLPYRDLVGVGQIADVLLVDQSPIGKSPRSNPVTYLKAFDEIRKVFAETVEAKTRNFTPSHFSFNVEGGRCETCQGDGQLAVDMQFLADVHMTCPTCGGDRYRREILEVRYRAKSIADVLRLTVREAFGFFRGQVKVQAKLKPLIDVGLEYLQLGQPASTLSGGEAQRLKLAGYMTSVKKARTLILLDEPTTGLHFADIVRLVDAFDALIGHGHSLIVVEHNTQLMRAADYIIDLGPGAAAAGGRVVAAGTPEEVAQVPDSATGRVLARCFQNSDQHRE